MLLFGSLVMCQKTLNGNFLVLIGIPSPRSECSRGELEGLEGPISEHKEALLADVLLKGWLCLLATSPAPGRGNVREF